MIINLSKIGGKILSSVLIFSLILTTFSSSSAQTYRLINIKKIEARENITRLVLNGFIGPPPEFELINKVSFFNHKNNPEMMLKQMTYLFPADFFNQVDKDPELYCLAQTAYWESRGESFTDKVAVVNVVMNRTRDPRFPNTACKVVKQACQFSWNCAGLGRIGIKVTEDNKYDLKIRSWVDSVLAALIAKNHLMDDPSKGATHFYAHKLVRPNWAVPNYVTFKDGSHTFVRIPCKSDC